VGEESEWRVGAGVQKAEQEKGSGLLTSNFRVRTPALEVAGPLLESSVELPTPKGMGEGCVGEGCVGA
jgi:hypothetical protein